MRRRVRAAVLLASALTLSACSGAADDGAGRTSSNTSTSSATPSQGTQVTVTRETLPFAGRDRTPVDGLTVRTDSQWGSVRIHAQWPQLAGATAFNDAVEKDARGRVDAFRGDFSGGGVAVPELTLTWSTLVAGQDVIGVRASESLFAGASTGLSSSTHYGTRDGEDAWTGADLVRAQDHPKLVDAAVRAAVAKGLRGTGADEVEPDASALLRDVTFTPDGTLQLHVAKGDLASADEGSVRVDVPKKVSDAWLTAAGKRVREASARPTPPATSSSVPSSGASGDTSTPAPTSPGTTSAPSSPTSQPPAAVDCARAKCIALTFDDGPGPQTPQVIDALTKAKARATFFVLGRSAAADPDTVRRLSESGMAVGSHTWSHRQLTNLSTAEVSAEWKQTADTLRSITGRTPNIARPPYGAYDDATPHDGQAFVLWDVDTEDWKNRNVAETTRRALEGAHPGAIILMHDIHPTSVQAVPGIVKALQDRGYTLVTVPELVGGTPQPGRNYTRGLSGR